MKSWKDPIILGAISNSDKFELIPPNKNLSVLGVDSVNGTTIHFECYARGTYIESFDANDCQLIARPISDMSDEEFGELYNRVPITIDGRHPTNEEVGRNNSYVVDGFLYLLSIGVYPLDQSHFESGEVIARYENKKESSI